MSAEEIAQVLQLTVRIKSGAVFELDIDKSKRYCVVRARDIARTSEALVGMIKLLKRPAKEVMTRAIMSLDDHKRNYRSIKQIKYM